MKLYNARAAAGYLVRDWIEQYGGMILGDSPTPDEVDACFASLPVGYINLVLRQFDCNECGKTFPEVVELGEAPDYESHTARICKGCLGAALSLIKGEGSR